VTVSKLGEGLHDSDGSNTKTTSQNTTSDYNVGADGTKTLVRYFVDGAEVKLDNQVEFEIVQPDGVRIEVWQDNQPLDYPLENGSTYRTIESKSVCTFTPIN